MRYSKKHKKYGYIVINSDGEVLDGIDEYGKPHFTAQYLLEELKLDAMVFQDRYRLPAQITSKLDTSHGLLEIKLNKEGKADDEAILNGRVIGSLSALMMPPNISPNKLGTRDNEYMSRAVWRDRN